MARAGGESAGASFGAVCAGAGAAGAAGATEARGAEGAGVGVAGVAGPAGALGGALGDDKKEPSFFWYVSQDCCGLARSCAKRSACVHSIDGLDWTQLGRFMVGVKTGRLSALLDLALVSTGPLGRRLVADVERSPV